MGRREGDDREAPPRASREALPEASSDAIPGSPEARTFGYSREWLAASPGARKEKRREQAFERIRGAKTQPVPRSPAPRKSKPLPYAELHCASAFSFLDGASLPEDLIERAAELGLPAIALQDRNGVYGAPRFYQAARQAGIRALVGAEVVVAAPPATSEPIESPRLTLLAGSRTGYKNLSKLLTAAARGRPKGEARTDRALLEAHAEGLWCLTGGPEGPLAHRLETHGIDGARRLLERLASIFPGRLCVELQRHHLREEEWRNDALVALARRLALPLVATNGARYARARDKELHDVLTCLRHKTHLDAAGRRLEGHRERHLKGASEMTRLFADLPQAVAASAELLDRLDFTLENLGYRFPDYPLPPGETPISYLRQLTWNEARARFRPLTARAQAQIAKELAMIEKLDLAGYFLIVHDIIQYCKRERILAQGRGSAANSAVCYALSITAVDPVKMGLLFERFLSEERGEWPDIDLDLPSGDQREKVIQYVYRRYGPHGAAMTANVITYRDRSSAREAAKALGYSREQQDKLSKRLGTWHYDSYRGDPKALDEELAAAGLDPAEPRVQLFARMWRRIHNLPRHLGQHSGGMVIAAGRLDEVVPLEPAAMDDRTVVQWDKDDCADLGIIKVDLLGLGMLQALEEMIPMIRTHEATEIDLAHLPPDDPKTYEMLRTADTVGVFQVESRAQMASLPRNNPDHFYDLVIQVAIIRPGPIAGGMVHPYFERRNGRQPVEYSHPCLQPILERTLGVPIFQEQILRIAMEAAGFTGGEAEELRRAMGFKRSEERMETIERRLRSGMAERGITGSAQDQIVQSITSFALYGFPESHAASFALIAYASAYLKCHHPTAFTACLLNAWPMGFYHPGTLVKDAQRHGVEARPIDVNHSGWKCRWERKNGDRIPISSPTDPQSHGLRNKYPVPAFSAAGALRLGLRYVKGLKEEIGLRIEAAQAAGPFESADDLVRRCALGEAELTNLAEAGALASLGLTRRAALWQVARAAKPVGPLLEDAADSPTIRGTKRARGEGSRQRRNRRRHDPRLSGRRTGQRPARNPADRHRSEPHPLPEMTPFEETVADYLTTGLTVGPHPLAHLRADLDQRGVTPTDRLPNLPHGQRVRIAGSVIVRQRPGTAKGVLFITVEDETGMAQAIVSPELLREHREMLVGSPGLVIEGPLTKKDGSLSIRAERFWKLAELAKWPRVSHDFR